MSKITDLPEIALPIADDTVLYIVDTSQGPNGGRKIKKSVLIKESLAQTLVGYVSGSPVNLLETDTILTGFEKLNALSNTKENFNNRGIANGYAPLDGSGLIPISYLPPAAIERLIVVANQASRFSLTIAVAQNGDTVKQTDDGFLFYIVDQTNLNNSSGYSVYTASTASSVPWGGITGFPSQILNLSGTNTGDQTNISGNSSTVTTNANLTGPITSIGNVTSINLQTGTGSRFVMDTAPNLITPNIGVATGSSLSLSSLGSAVNPTIKIVDNGLGFYKIATDNLGISSLGVLKVDINATRTLFTTPIQSNSGELNLKLLTTLTDADSLLTGTQLSGGLFTISPTVTRTLTTDTAVNIIAALSGSVDNSHYEFTIVNVTAIASLISPGVGVTIIGSPNFTNSGTWRVRRLTSSTVALYRMDQSLSTNAGVQTLISANITLDATYNKASIIVLNSASNVVITIPAGLTSAYSVSLIQDGTGDVSFIGTGGVVIKSLYNMTKIQGANCAVFLEQQGSTNIYYLIGKLKT